MLGLYNYIANSKAVQSIVRGGLQLFYKADRTQAPLGEEQIRNNSFDEIGGNLVSNPTFDLGSEAVQNGTFNLGSEEVVNGDFATDLSSWDISGTDATHTVTYSNGSARYQSDSVTPQLNFDQTISNVEVGKTYQLSIDVTYTTGSLKVSSIDTNQTVLSNGLNVFSVVANSKTIRLLRSASIVDALINSISLKEVPNWGLQSPWSINNNKAFYDVTEINYISQSGLTITAGKTYQVSFDIEDSSGQSRMLISNQAANESYSPYTYRANGSYVVTFTSSTNQSTLAFKGHTSGTSFSLSNVSLKEVPNWTLGDGWSIANDVAIQSGGVGQLSQTGVLAAGKSYSVSVTIDSIASGTSLKVSLGSGGDELLFSNIGTTTLIGSTSSSVGNQILYLLGNESGFSGSISNISVKQLDPNNRWNVQNPDTSAHTVEIREGETYINYDHDGGTQGGTGITQSGVFPNTTSKYEIEVELGEVTGQLKVQARGISTTINSSDSNTTKVILLDSSSDSQTHIFIVRLENYISGSAFVKNVSVKEITNSIKDHSRNSNDGILYSGKALEFDTDDGSNDFIVLNDANLPGEFTVCTWVEPHSFNQCNIFGDDANENWIRIHSALSITVKINDNSSGYAPIAHGGNIALNKWSRVVVTRGSDNIIRFGINGTLYSPSNVARAGNFNFNRLGVKDGLQMNGALADVQVYDKAWNATDVKYDWENPDKDVFDRVGEAQVLGEELNDLSWVANVGWSINGDIASNDGGGSTLTNDILELGKTYQFKCKLSSYTSGDFRLMLGSASTTTTISSTFSSTDEFTFIGVCAGDTSARVQSLNGGIGSLLISSLTIKEVTTHASHILPTDCKSLLRLNEGAGDRVYDAAPVLGAEEVTNGDFAANSDWTKRNGSTINNVANVIAGGSIGSSSANWSLESLANVFETSKTYRIKFRAKQVSLAGSNAGTFQVGNSYGALFDEVITSEFVDYTFTAQTSSNYWPKLTIGGRIAGDVFQIDDISVKEIKPAESFFITGDKNFLHQQPYIPQYAMSSFSKKMVFDGSNDYVTGSFNGNIGPAKDMTFSCWFSYEDSVEAVNDRKTLFALLSNPNDTYPYRKLEVSIIENNRLFAFTGDGVNNYSTTSTTQNRLVKNKLNHVAVSISSTGEVKVYINGALEVTGSSTYFGAATVTHYRIGSRDNTTMLNKGIIDEVSLFKSELTQAEVLELYNSGSSFDSTGHSKYNLGEEVSNGTFELGSEEVVNGDFATDSDWVEGLGFDISGGVMNYDGSAIQYRRANQVLNTEIGALYKLQFTLNDLSASGVNFGLGNSDGSFSGGIAQQTYSSDGTYTRYMVATAEDHSIVIQNNSATQTFNVDNISVKKIPNWSFGDGWSYVDGKASLVQVSSSEYLSQELTGLVNGRTYVISFDLDISSSASSIGVSSTGAFGDASSSDRFHSTNGRKTFTAVYDSSHQSGIKELRFVGTSGAAFTIDNVSVQEYGVSGYWRNNGADQWDDLSINSNHGTVSGSPTEIFLQEVPFFGKDSLGMFMNKPRLGGLNFAKNGWVEVRDNVSLDVASTNAISVCCWYRANSAASYDAAQYLVNSETYSNAGGWTLIAGTTQIVWTAEVGSNASIGYNHNDRLGWQYIVATYDEQNYRLFTFDENGNISVTTPVASTSALVDEYPINIGGFNEGSGSLINGVIDDIKIYNKALTQAEIKKNYNATKGRHKN